MVHLSGSPYVATARWFRDRQEADEELAGKSASDLEAALIPGMALPERLNYELVYLEETGQHLDQKNATLVAGSRYPDGACRRRWHDSKFSVHWYHVGDSHPESARPFRRLTCFSFLVPLSRGWPLAACGTIFYAKIIRRLIQSVRFLNIGLPLSVNKKLLAHV